MRTSSNSKCRHKKGGYTAYVVLSAHTEDGLLVTHYRCSLCNQDKYEREQILGIPVSDKMMRGHDLIKR
jgi:hypothetical protein